MIDRDLGGSEAPVLSAEAANYADEAIAGIIAALGEDMSLTGREAHDQTQLALREYDRKQQTELGPDWVYFGHTRCLEEPLYEALVSGYAPNDRQIQMCEDEGGHNFMWDEVTDLVHEHPDTFKIIESYSYGSNKTPIAIPFVGAYALPRDTLKEVIGVMFMKGREYREWGWGFPWFSDEIPAGETGAMK